VIIKIPGDVGAEGIGRTHAHVVDRLSSQSVDLRRGDELLRDSHEGAALGRDYGAVRDRRSVFKLGGGALLARVDIAIEPHGIPVLVVDADGGDHRAALYNIAQTDAVFALHRPLQIILEAELVPLIILQAFDQLAVGESAPVVHESVTDIIDPVLRQDKGDALVFGGIEVAVIFIEAGAVARIEDDTTGQGGIAAGLAPDLRRVPFRPPEPVVIDIPVGRDGGIEYIAIFDPVRQIGGIVVFTFSGRNDLGDGKERITLIGNAAVGQIGQPEAAFAALQGRQGPVVKFSEGGGSGRRHAPAASR